MGRLALTVGYDGGGFAGSQIQPGARTVQGEMNAALAALFGRPAATTFAGRTDRGVHAAGQVVGCADARPDLDVATIRRALNARLPEDIAVIGVDRRADAFHARFDAEAREYRYRIWTGGRAPNARRQVWERRSALDLPAMGEAAGRLVGRHDFAVFAGGGDGVPWSERRRRPRGTTRMVTECVVAGREPWWGPGGDGHVIELRIVADGFLPRMVRNIVGALVEIGEGKRPVGEVDRLLAAGDRRLGAGTAPAHGLTLWNVVYPVGDRRTSSPVREARAGTLHDPALAENVAVASEQTKE